MNGRTPIDARWPWMTRRRVVVLVVFACAVGVAIPWNHRSSERQFLAQMDQALPMSAALSADGISDWATAHVAHVKMLATIAAHSSGPPRTVLEPILPVVIAENRYRDGQIEAMLTQQTPPALTSIPPFGETRNAVAEFRAPIVRSGRTVETVVLRMVISESAFSHFNIAAPDDRTQRTLLLLRNEPTDSTPMSVLAVSGPGGGIREAASVSLPPGIRTDVAARASYATAPAVARTPHGIGRGITGATVVFSVVAVPGTPWLLVREREVAELQSRIRPALFITDAIFGIVSALVVGVLLLRWRAQHQREQTVAAQLRATFVASVSHELRTPLTQVRMYAEMLRLELLATPEERRRALGVIEKEAERLTLLIERALAYVRSGKAAPPMPQESVVVAHAVVRALEAISAIADERHVRLRYDIDATLTVRMARDELHQVLLNLLDNAIKYGPVGQMVEITAEVRDGRVRLIVRDQGAGVPPAERESIWQPFHRGQAAAAGDAVGSGIGLVVVRDLVERAGGTAYVDGAADWRARDAGAVFTVELPPGT